MLAKRIIPCLDVKNGRVVKGVNFLELRDAGDPVEQAQVYDREGADELVFLDITATLERRRAMMEAWARVSLGTLGRTGDYLNCALTALGAAGPWLGRLSSFATRSGKSRANSPA